MKNYAETFENYDVYASNFAPLVIEKVDEGLYNAYLDGAAGRMPAVSGAREFIDGWLWGMVQGLHKRVPLANAETAETLADTIDEDCRYWESMHNEGRMSRSALRLHRLYDSKVSGMYSLQLNCGVLWYGTLREINAIVKSMCFREEDNDWLGGLE